MIVEQYQTPIFNLMYRAVGSFDQAADLSQEAFLKAYRNLHKYRPGKSFFAWLYTVSMNVARDHLRRQKRIPRMDSIDQAALFASQQGGDPALETIKAEEVQRLEQALARLPIDYREAIILKYRKELDTKQVARMLGISVSGVKMRVHRAIKKLQELLRHDEPG